MLSEPSEIVEALQRTRTELEGSLRERNAERMNVTRCSISVREAAERLASLAVGQSPARIDAERDLRALEEKMHRALDRLASKEFDTDGLYGVRGTRVGELAITRYGRPDEEGGRLLRDGWSQVWEDYTSEITTIKSLLAELNDERAVAGARAEVAQAMRALDAARRRSAESFPPPLSLSFESSAILAATPFLLFLLIAAVGTVVGPTRPQVWIAIAALVLVTAGALWRTLRRGATTGVLAGLGAAGSLALFTAAYLSCRALDASSVIREGSPGVPIDRISEASFAALTVGVTGGTIGIELNGAARVVAFIQILLTVSGVIAVFAHGWQALLARLNPTAPNSPAD